MLRIVWGVILILAGLTVIADTILEHQLIQFIQSSGLKSFAPLPSSPPALLRFIIGFCLSGLGSFSVYFGDDARLARLERAIMLSPAPPGDDSRPFDPPSPRPPSRATSVQNISAR